MIERLARNPLALAGAFLLSALLGAGIFAAIQHMLPGNANRAEVERIVRGYILAHPEILPEAMGRLRASEDAKARAAEVEAQKSVPALLPTLQKPYGSAWAGNPQGDVTIVAFMDYACGYCRASLPAIDELLAKYKNVRIVYREYPVLGPDSAVAARWALAAAEQGKFLAFHQALYAAGPPDPRNIAAAAATAGLDMAKARAAIDSKAVAAELGANQAIGGKLAMTGTPSWVIGSTIAVGARDYAGLAEAVAAARAR